MTTKKDLGQAHCTFLVAEQAKRHKAAKALVKKVEDGNERKTAYSMEQIVSLVAGGFCHINEDGAIAIDLHNKPYIHIGRITPLK